MNIWETLGIEPTKNIEVIKEAYAQKAAMYHPEEHLEEFKLIQRAYHKALDDARLDLLDPSKEVYVVDLDEKEREQKREVRNEAFDEVLEEMENPNSFVMDISAEGEKKAEEVKPVSVVDTVKETIKGTIKDTLERNKEPEQPKVMDYSKTVPIEDFVKALNAIAENPDVKTRNDVNKYRFLFESPTNAQRLKDRAFLKVIVENVARFEKVNKAVWEYIIDYTRVPEDDPDYENITGMLLRVYKAKNEKNRPFLNMEPEKSRKLIIAGVIVIAVLAVIFRSIIF